MYVCSCVCEHVCICLCKHIYAFVCECVHACVCVHAYIHVKVCMASMEGRGVFFFFFFKGGMVGEQEIELVITLGQRPNEKPFQSGCQLMLFIKCHSQDCHNIGSSISGSGEGF